MGEPAPRSPRRKYVGRAVAIVAVLAAMAAVYEVARLWDSATNLPDVSGQVLWLGISGGIFVLLGSVVMWFMRHPFRISKRSTDRTLARPARSAH